MTRRLKVRAGAADVDCMAIQRARVGPVLVNGVAEAAPERPDPGAAAVPRQQAEDALRESEARHRILFES
jgi:hypothetical protein